MKPVTVAISIAVLALPIYAEDQQKPNTTTTTLTAPASAQAQDSPLVRAAKAAGQVNKKATIVITNETLLSGRSATADVMADDSEAKTRRDAAAMKLQRLKNSSADYYRQLAPHVPPAPPQPQPVQTEGQRASTVQPPTTSTATVPYMSTTQVGTISTAPVNTTPATQARTSGTTQPQTATPVRPPER